MNPSMAFACEEVMIGLLLGNEADCLIPQHTAALPASP
jgi:hypothetical protein